MSDLKFSGFGGPARPIQSDEVIGILESGSSYQEGTPHSTMLREAKQALAGIKKYIKDYCRPQIGRRKTNDYSPSNSKEFSARVSNDQ
ncbi:hypothetical protein [Pseudomonas putida]|uniref:Uncharacterized protein n=1 Tax=Pseudomonas putida TaxID=303 RepID=A0A8I1ECX8_PSEPU|nr:hypothetical protein [Pseudomonas putida]MBI6882973.1 hypothetical protein [Pseudomonas putida]